MDLIEYGKINNLDSTIPFVKIILIEQIVYVYNIDREINKEIMYKVNEIMNFKFSLLSYFKEPNGLHTSLPTLGSFLLYDKDYYCEYLNIYFFRFESLDDGINLLNELLIHHRNIKIHIKLDSRYESETIDLCNSYGFEKCHDDKLIVFMKYNKKSDIQSAIGNDFCEN